MVRSSNPAINFTQGSMLVQKGTMSCAVAFLNLLGRISMMARKGQATARVLSIYIVAFKALETCPPLVTIGAIQWRLLMSAELDMGLGALFISDEIAGRGKPGTGIFLHLHILTQVFVFILLLATYSVSAASPWIAIIFIASGDAIYAAEMRRACARDESHLKRRG